jgi:hypothetical protein
MQLLLDLGYLVLQYLPLLLHRVVAEVLLDDCVVLHLLLRGVVWWCEVEWCGEVK